MKKEELIREIKQFEIQSVTDIGLKKKKQSKELIYLLMMNNLK